MCVRFLLRPIAFGVVERGGDAVEAAAEVGRAEGADLEGAGEAADIERLEASAAERMTQQRHRLGRCEIADHGADDEGQEGARHGLGERPAGAVVDADAPGFKADRDAPGQEAIRRDERCRAPRHLDGFAQDECHGLGLVLRRRGFDQRHAGEGLLHLRLIGFRREAVPERRRRRRAHGLAEEGGAGPARSIDGDARERAHLMPGDAEAVEQLLRPNWGCSG